jgi:hypothetical protein
MCNNRQAHGTAHILYIFKEPVVSPLLSLNFLSAKPEVDEGE